MLQKKTVTAETLALTKRLMADPRLNDFILVGGTALALTIGHRKSIDIDLFTVNPFDAPNVAAILEKEYGAEFIKIGKGGINCFINGIKTDLISHRYPMIEPAETIEGIRICSMTDLAAFKLHAIANTGSRIKDFIDIHFMLEKMPLFQMYAAYERKYYPNTSREMASLALRDHSRIDFKEPVMLFGENLDWPKISSRLLDAIERPGKIFMTNVKQSLQLKPEPSKQIKRGKRM